MATEASSFGIEAVAGFLDERGARYEVVEHRTTHSAAAEARAAGFAPADAAKTILLRDEDGYRLAVIPASERLDLAKTRELLGAGKSLRFATEEEMKADLGDFEVGALPPFGTLVNAAELVDRRLLDHERVLCSGGDHQHGVLLDPNELVRLGDAKVADICEG